METNTQLIPAFEPSKAQTALAEVETLKAALAPLEHEARALKVETPEAYEVAGTLLKRVRDNRKQGEEVVKPLKRVVQTIKDWLQTESLKHSNKCEQIEGVITPKMNAYKVRERELAAAEERRINEERRKETERLAQEQRMKDLERIERERKAQDKEIADAVKAGEVKKREADKLRRQAEERERVQREQAARDAEAMKASHQDIKVAPNTPKVAGLRQRQQWHFEVINRDEIKRAFMIEDEKAIGQFVRNVKNAKVAEESVGGIRVWSTDEI
jgi:hypothetical protein